MEPNEHPPTVGILTGVLTIALRLAVTFLVVFAGYFTYHWFGEGWFRVFVFAAIAFFLHLELKRIEREHPTGDGES